MAARCGLWSPRVPGRGGGTPTAHSRPHPLTSRSFPASTPSVEGSGVWGAEPPASPPTTGARPGTAHPRPVVPGHRGGTAGQTRPPRGSPRVRGAGHQFRLRVRVQGTTPAGAGSSAAESATRSPCPAAAGSSRTPASDWATTWDHRRGCGEQRTETMTFTLKQGPSPRVRGAAVTACQVGQEQGTIPAREQTARLNSGRATQRPSTRVRGPDGTPSEHGSEVGTLPAGAGAVLTGRVDRGGAGTIPAGAGERRRPLARLLSPLQAGGGHLTAADDSPDMPVAAALPVCRATLRAGERLHARRHHITLVQVAHDRRVG